MKDNKSIKQNSKIVLNRDENYEYIVPAVDRAARILMLLRQESRDMTIAEITEATGWHKSSVHKLLVTLTHHGLLDRNEATKRYSLGMVLIGYGQFVLNNLDIAYAAKSFLKELADFSGETANYSVLRGKRVVVVDSIESRLELRVVPPVGTTDSLTAKSTGKAILAFLPEKQADKIIQADGLGAFTKNSITDPKAFHKELAAIRKQGFATDFEEFRDGISAVSAPVFSATGQVKGGLTLVAPAFRMTKNKAMLYGKKCAQAAAQLSSMIS